MVYVLVIFMFYTGKPVERLTIIHPSPWLCEAQIEGIQSKLQKDVEMFKAQGVEKIVMKCIPMKEA